MTEEADRTTHFCEGCKTRKTGTTLMREQDWWDNYHLCKDCLKEVVSPRGTPTKAQRIRQRLDLYGEGR